MASTGDYRKLGSHPPYPEMILSAIAELGEKEGSSESSISKLIEATYGDSLPAGHTAALSAALAKLRESGELLFVKNNYLKADPDSTPRRGRGRPPKPKVHLSPDAVPSTPRPRGRPPKPKDLLAEAVAKATSGLPRRRGRPSKKQRPGVGGAPSAASKVGVLSPAVSGVKRGRGRPPKVREPLVSDVAVE